VDAKEHLYGRSQQGDHEMQLRIAVEAEKKRRVDPNVRKRASLAASAVSKEECRDSHGELNVDNDV